ncbi:sphingomyelin phosphodiesterase B-like [Penaeus japonicus]|uniref:sphingomyelin phosphodiesterase B-like n=1 Tax=Penaeus japonicus TaxID=27405 RepID=UPI001C712B4C|nr:sphingomyelin phosphodiesterase B-like [Penaeus japonicus]
MAGVVLCLTVERQDGMVPGHLCPLCPSSNGVRGSYAKEHLASTPSQPRIRPGGLLALDGERESQPGMPRVRVGGRPPAKEIAAGITYEALVQEAVQICVTQVGMTEAFCAGYVPQVAPILYYIFTHNDVSAVDFCGMVLSYWGCTTNNPDREWSVLIHGEKPPVEPVMLPEPDAPRLKVLHLSDTHMDPSTPRAPARPG